jgi:hypothetical protein
MNRQVVGVVLVLSMLLLGCFARLAADPSSLIVDAERPSVDHARPLDDPSVGNDLTRLFLPHHLAIARAWSRLGRVPLWDDRGFGGRPLVGNPQGGLFYPPVWVAWWTGSASSLGWITVAHLLFLGLGTYRLARTLGIGVWGSLVASGCVQVSPYVLAQTFEGHYPHVWAACWYPWAFDAAVKLRRGDRLAGLMLVPILAATLLAGHPQEGYYLLIALGFWAAYDGLKLIWTGRVRGYTRISWWCHVLAPSPQPSPTRGEGVRRKRQSLSLWSPPPLWGRVRVGGPRGATRNGGHTRVRRALGFWVWWSGILLLTIGLTAVEWIPDLLAQKWTLKGARNTLRLAGRYHVYPVNLIQLLSPTALGGPSDYFGHENYWESVLSIGLIPLALAMIGVAWSSDRRLARSWLILVVVSVLFAFGRKFGVFPLLFEIVPGMNHFRVPARSLFLGSLGASILAGLGVEALRSRADQPEGWGRLARRSSLFAGLAAGLILSGPLLPTAESGEAGEIDRLKLGLARLAAEPTLWLALGVFPVALVVSWKVAGVRRKIPVILGLLGLVELGYHGQRLIVTTPSARYFGQDPISEALLQSRPEERPPTRIRVVDALYDDLRAEQQGLSKTNVNDSFQIQHAADLYETLYHLFDAHKFLGDAPMDQVVADYRREIRQAVLDRMGVSLLVDDRLDPEAPWPRVASGEWTHSPYAVYRNPSALPRAYVVPKVALTSEDRFHPDQLRTTDPHQAVLMAFDPLGPDQTHRQPFKAAEWTSDDPDRVVLKVETEAPGLLVIAETWMPGWSATVDGKASTIFRGNRAQRVVTLPEPGTHEVVLSYRTPGLTLGIWLTAGSSLAWIIALIAVGRRKATSLPDLH